MKTEIMTVTPAMAEKWIKGSTGINRPLKMQIVRQYASEMTAGKWKENGESIIFDDNGNILDGQHRLHAIVMSRNPVKIVVVRGIASDTYDTMDSGTRRSGKDILFVAGYKDSSNLAAALSAIHRYKVFGFDESRSPASNEKKRPRYKNDFLELIRLYPNAQISATYIHSRTKNCVVFRPSSFAACMHYVFGEKNAMMRDAFFEAIYEKKYLLGQRDPVKKLQTIHENQDKMRAVSVNVKLRAEYWENAFADFCGRAKRLTPRVYLSTDELEWFDRTNSLRA